MICRSSTRPTFLCSTWFRAEMMLKPLKGPSWLDAIRIAAFLFRGRSRLLGSTQRTLQKLPLGPSHFVEALLIVLGGRESWPAWPGAAPLWIREELPWVGTRRRWLD